MFVFGNKAERNTSTSANFFFLSFFFSGKSVRPVPLLRDPADPLPGRRRRSHHRHREVSTVGETTTTQPPTVACKMEAQSEHVHVACTFLHVLAPILRAQSAIINEISAPELGRKAY